MKKMFLLLAGVMIALCVTACTPKTSTADNSLEAQIQRSQDYLDHLKSTRMTSKRSPAMSRKSWTR